MAKNKLKLSFAKKCPACHSIVSSGSYRCPRCKIYFCARCGQHLRKGTHEFICKVTNCPYQNIILCENCVDIETAIFEFGWIMKERFELSRWNCIGCNSSSLWMTYNDIKAVNIIDLEENEEAYKQQKEKFNEYERID
jgi:hypothetical protein